MTTNPYNTGLNFTPLNPNTQNKEKDTQAQQDKDNVNSNTANTQTNPQSKNIKQEIKSEYMSNSTQNPSSNTIKSIGIEASEKLNQTTSSEENSQKEKNALDRLKEQLQILQEQLEKTSDMELKMQLISQIVVLMAQIAELQKILGDSEGLNLKA